MYYVYIMAGRSRVLYTGVTRDLERRSLQHKWGATGGFTKRYHVTKLVYFEEFTDIVVAISREKEIKGWRRDKKIALIESINPRWLDFAITLYFPTSSILSE